MRGTQNSQSLMLSTLFTRHRRTFFENFPKSYCYSTSLLEAQLYQAITNVAGPEGGKIPGPTQNLPKHLSTYLVSNLVLKLRNGHFSFTKFYRHYRKTSKCLKKQIEYTMVMMVKLSKGKVPIR